MKTILRVVGVLAAVYVLGLATVFVLGHSRRTTGAFEVSFRERSPQHAVRDWRDQGPANGERSMERSGHGHVEIVREGNGFTLVLGDGFAARGCRIHGEREMTESGSWLTSGPRDIDVRDAQCQLVLADGTPGVLTVSGYFGFGGGFRRAPSASLMGAVRTEHSAPIAIPFVAEGYQLFF